MEPFLTYRFQGYKFEFIRDEIYVTSERHLPFFEKFQIVFTDDNMSPFLIRLVEKGMKRNES